MISENEQLRQLSGSDFASLGLQHVAYVRPVTIKTMGTKSYAIHAADGTQLAVLEGLDLAHATILENDMRPVSVH